MKNLFLVAAIALPLSLSAQVDVKVYPNTLHKVGEVSTFDREKYIVMHSGLTDGDWKDEPEALDLLLNKYDAYFGRDNGSMGWNFNSAKEDPARKGYALVSGDRYSIEELGKASRKTWATKHQEAHKYDDKSAMMVGGQISWCWPGNKTRPFWDKTGGYESASGEAVGEYMGHYLNNFYRKDGESVEMGQKQPKYLEVVNEPFYALIDDWMLKPEEKKPPIDIFNFHNDVARGIRKHNKDVQIGGYTVAFPYFDLQNFERWNERMKLFYDTCGEHMDFMSVHFYDFNRPTLPLQNAWKKAKIERFRGGRIEATLDMMEQYSYLTLGKVKPFLISEYGGRNHQLERGVWSAERDWVFMKSFSPMMMSFMDRPNNILKAIPFILTKVKYEEKGDSKYPYPWRMFRHIDEPESFKDPEYVLTEQMKFYEFWADIKGQRVAIESSNPDIMSDAYINGNKLYVILSNLDENPQTINIALAQMGGKKLKGITAKELKWGGKAPVIAESKLKEGDSYSISRDGTVIVEYRFAGDVKIAEVQTERKYYAESYLQPIEANKSIDFTIKNIDTSTPINKGVIRLSMGRKLNTSRTPKVKVNGVDIKVPDNFMGDDQTPRGQFFGMVEIEVDGKLLKSTNNISVTFPDTDGFVSSLTLRAYAIK